MNLFNVVFNVARENHLSNVLTILTNIAQKTTETITNVCSGSTSDVTTAPGMFSSTVSYLFGANTESKADCISNVFLIILNSCAN